jgi:hypothetical protein
LWLGTLEAGLPLGRPASSFLAPLPSPAFRLFVEPYLV